jgi:hypothetical protein
MGHPTRVPRTPVTSRDHTPDHPRYYKQLVRRVATVSQTLACRVSLFRCVFRTALGRSWVTNLLLLRQIYVRVVAESRTMRQ